MNHTPLIVAWWARASGAIDRLREFRKAYPSGWFDFWGDGEASWSQVPHFVADAI